MKLLVFASTLLFGTLSNACPLTAAAYSEIAIPCNGATVDYSQPVSMNLPSDHGGECRVELANGQAMHVASGQVILTSADGQDRVIGVLKTAPFCYQTDTDGEYYSSWDAVTLSL